MTKEGIFSRVFKAITDKVYTAQLWKKNFQTQTEDCNRFHDTQAPLGACVQCLSHSGVGPGMKLFTSSRNLGHPDLLLIWEGELGYVVYTYVFYHWVLIISYWRLCSELSKLLEICVIIKKKGIIENPSFKIREYRRFINSAETFKYFLTIAEPCLFVSLLWNFLAWRLRESKTKDKLNIIKTF